MVVVILENLWPGSAYSENILLTKLSLYCAIYESTTHPLMEMVLSQRNEKTYIRQNSWAEMLMKKATT